MDHATDEVYEQPEKVGVDDLVVDAKGFPGGPHSTSFFMDYIYQVALTVWNEKVFIF